MPQKSVQIFGDSVFKGVLLDEKTMKYCPPAGNLFGGLAEKYGAEITNHSVFGCTVTKGTRYLNDVLDNTLPCDVAVMEYGGNDSDFNWVAVSQNPRQEHASFTPPEAFEVKYRALVDRLLQKNIRVVLSNLPPIDSNLYLDWIERRFHAEKDQLLIFLRDPNRIYRYQEIYSGIVTRIARETGCELLDIRTEFLKRIDFLSLLCVDGIHPNESGQKIIIDCLDRCLADIL